MAISRDVLIHHFDFFEHPSHTMFLVPTHTLSPDQIKFLTDRNGHTLCDADEYYAFQDLRAGWDAYAVDAAQLHERRSEAGPLTVFSVFTVEI